MKKEEQNNITEKLLKLYSHNEIENSRLNINMIQKKIDNCKSELDYLMDNKPYWFQKKKLYIYDQKIEELNKKIHKCNLEIEEQLEIINKLKNY